MGMRTARAKRASSVFGADGRAVTSPVARRDRNLDVLVERAQAVAVGASVVLWPRAAAGGCLRVAGMAVAPR